jgi:hypothetical protein
MAWGKADDYFSTGEAEYRKKKLQEELTKKYAEFKVDVNYYLSFYREVQSYLAVVDKALEKALGVPSSLDTDKFYVSIVNGEVAIAIDDYYQKGGELHIHANRVSWAGPATHSSLIYLDVPVFTASEDYLVLNLVGSSRYVVEFNTDGLIIAYQNGIYSPIAYKYSVLEGKVVEWKC